jgi:NAD(P)H-flavin reductase
VKSEYADDAERPTILVAGGTSIAPIKAMLEAAQTGPKRELHRYRDSRRSRLYVIAEISATLGTCATGVSPSRSRLRWPKA